MTRRTQLSLSLLALALLLGALAGGAWIWWRAGEEFRADLPMSALPSRVHMPLDCAAVLRRKPMVLLLLGQSNAANHVQQRAVAGPGVFAWHEGQCYAAIDPLPGASGYGGSLWTRMAPMAIDSGQYDSVLLVPLAMSLTSIAQWARHPALTQTLQSAMSGLRRGGHAVTHVVWYQGEAESFKNTSAQDYRAAFAKVHERLRQGGVQAPIWVAQATLCQARSNPAVRAEQARLPALFAGVRAGPDMDALFGPEHRFDGCHFNAGGAQRAADEWLRKMLSEAPVASRSR